MDKTYTAAELQALPTLSVAQADDLKIDNGDGERVWLGRVESGRIFHEKFNGSRWETVREYQG